MKKIIIFNVIILNGLLLFSQQDEQISLIYFDHMAINAGFAGNRNAICANAIVRNQWLGFDNGQAAISTQIFNINAPIKLFGINHGVGLVIKNDMITPASNTNLNLAYAYNTEVGQGNLGIGIDFGFMNRKLDGTKFISSELDGIIPTTEVSDMIFDIGLGAFYRTDNLYLGVSGKHLNPGQAAEYGAGISSEKIVPHFYISGGYTYQLTNPLFEIQPSVHFKSGGLKSQVSYNARVLYNKKLWGGVSYNHGDAIVTMFGMEIPSGFKFAVAYDVPLTKVANAGSIEFMLGYCFNLSVEKTTPSYKSVRFL